MKKAKSTFIPEFYVDLTNAKTTEEVANAFKMAKEAAGVVDDNKDWLIDASITIIIPSEEKKSPWYKRFWNWITRKK